MEQIVEGIRLLNEKSIEEAGAHEGIKEFIKYKYPIEPSTNDVGQDIYAEILSRVDSRWDEGELSTMKVRSKSRTGSPASKKWR